jgi:exopolysaccharide production protein ExoY
MRSKRFFDLALCLAGGVVWVPTVLLGALLVLLMSGRPIFYASMRKVETGEPIRIVKFRTMVRNAAELVNRDTVPCEDNVRFLNIPPDSPLYTRPGRLLERFGVTELPQFVHILRGEMSMVGNRPLPQNVMDCLAQEHGNAGDRFLTPAGLTGPAQLVGRQALSDRERLDLEGAYSLGCLRSYSVLLDIKIIVMTVLIVLHLRPSLSYQGVLALIDRHTTGSIVQAPPTDLTIVTPAPAPQVAGGLGQQVFPSVERPAVEA